MPRHKRHARQPTRKGAAQRGRSPVRRGVPAPAVAFVADSLNVHREQFILIHKARPLPERLINELLPETDLVSLAKRRPGPRRPLRK
jgi:hypothetical protein